MMRGKNVQLGIARDGRAGRIAQFEHDPSRDIVVPFEDLLKEGRILLRQGNDDPQDVPLASYVQDSRLFVVAGVPDLSTFNAVVAPIGEAGSCQDVTTACWSIECDQHGQPIKEGSWKFESHTLPPLVSAGNWLLDTLSYLR